MEQPLSSDVAIDKMLDEIHRAEKASKDVDFERIWNKHFSKYGKKACEKVKDYMEQESLIWITKTPFLADSIMLGHIGMLAIKEGGWLKYVEGIREENRLNEEKENEKRELDRRNVEAAERSAESAEKSADWSVSSARTAKWSMWASWVLLAITTFGIGVSAKKIKEVEVLELKLSEQQKEIEQLKEVRKELDSLRAVVKVLGEKGLNPAEMKSKFY